MDNQEAIDVLKGVRTSFKDCLPDSKEEFEAINVAIKALESAAEPYSGMRLIGDRQVSDHETVEDLWFSLRAYELERYNPIHEKDSPESGGNRDE